MNEKPQYFSFIGAVHKRSSNRHIRSSNVRLNDLNCYSFWKARRRIQDHAERRHECGAASRRDSTSDKKSFSGAGIPRLRHCPRANHAGLKGNARVNRGRARRCNRGRKLYRATLPEQRRGKAQPVDRSVSQKTCLKTLRDLFVEKKGA